MSNGSTNSATSGRVLDQLPDTRLELDRSHDPHLETEVSQRATQVIVEGNGLRLHKLAVGQKHPQLLAAQRLHMDRSIKSHSHHLRHATSVISFWGLLRRRSSPEQGADFP